jgi:hypothetical protein
MSDFLNSLPDYGATQQPQQSGASFLDAQPDYTGGGSVPGSTPTQPTTWKDSLIDAAKTIPSGLARGAAAVAGLPGALKDAVNIASDYIMPLPQEGKDTLAANKWMLPDPQQVTGAVEGVTGPLYQPKTQTGKYVNSVAEMAPGVLLGPGSLLFKVASAMGAGIGSEAAGQATAGTAAEPYARIGGAVIGGVLPNVAARAITPLPISAARQDAINTLESNGVTSLTAGQKTGSVPLRYGESFLGDAPFSGGKAAAVRMKRVSSSQRQRLLKLA